MSASISGASRKIQSSICQITRFGRRSIAAASTKLCSWEFEPVIASLSERTPSALSMSLWRKWIASEVPMKTVSKSWLRIRPASCMRLSGEYIAGNSRAGRNSCSGSTTKFSAAASRMMARRRA